MSTSTELRRRYSTVAFFCILGLALASVFGARAVEGLPTTIVFFDSEWSHDLSQRRPRSDETLQEFTQQSGIKVERSAAPESALDQLDLLRSSLKTNTSMPDAYELDVIWASFLEKDSIDLKPYFSDELRMIDPALVASYSVDGKLVGMPYHPNQGALYYRKDLLREYGYKEPPRTWDELERMAARIQKGERAKGRTDFWGYVWPGDAGEGLTCNALEWQVDNGGGHIIEADQTISVNNPQTIRSWERAAQWIGSISPPSITSYGEWDAVQAFLSKRAAFFRGWARNQDLGTNDENDIPDWLGSTRVPAGSVAQVSTVGGFGLGVSRASAHSKETLEFVRFMLHKEIDLELDTSRSARSDIYSGPRISSRSDSGSGTQTKHGSLVSRPSSITGEKYEEVDRAYIQAVHSVLTGKSGAREAAANLQAELVKITGFKVGPPR